MRPHRSTVFFHNELNTRCSKCDTSTFYALEIVHAIFFIWHMRHKHFLWTKKRFFGLFSGFGDICPCVQCCVFLNIFWSNLAKAGVILTSFLKHFKKIDLNVCNLLYYLVFFLRAPSMASTSHFGSSVKTSTVLRLKKATISFPQKKKIKFEIRLKESLSFRSTGFALEEKTKEPRNVIIFII